MLGLRLSNASRALFIILKFILFPGKSSRFWLPLRPVRANGGPKVQMSYPELFWNNPLKLNWVSAAFEILISQGCLILITHQGGNYALRSSSCQKSSCQSYQQHRSSLLSPFYQRDSWEQRREGESYVRKFNTAESWHVPNCSFKGNHIFWCCLIRVK